MLCKTILVWGIPPLSPQPPAYIERNSTHIPPFIITLPESLQPKYGFPRLETISPWYHGSSEPLYFGLMHNSEIHDFEIVIKPNGLGSLHLINTCHITPNDIAVIAFPSKPASICENILFSYLNDRMHRSLRIHIRPMSSCLSNVILPKGLIALNLSLPGIEVNHTSLCPSSGRFAYLGRNDGRKILVADFL